MLVILPFWTSFLIRVYAWIGILKPEGLLNQFLLWLGLIDQPLIITNTNWAVFIGIVYSYLPFMVLPLYASLEKLDHTLLEAAADLGSPPLEAFWQITFPLSLPGVIAGSMLVFIPAVGEFVIPDLLGGSSDADDRQDAVGRVLPQPRLADGLDRRGHPAARPGRADRVLPERAGARAGAQPMKRFSAFNLVSLVLGFAFLYLPILLLVIYSFNESRLVTVWGGFSTKWYAALLAERGDPRRRLGDDPRRASSRPRSPPCSARWRRSRSSGAAASSGARSSPAWSSRRSSCRR